MSVELVNEAEARVDEQDLVELAAHVLAQLRLDPGAELSVMCIDPAEMASLHEQWLAEPGPTDVLSFPMDELRPGPPGGPAPTGVLGDVVLCPAVAAAQAASAGHSTQHELRILLAHGILHLLGFDHAEPAAEAEMFDLQRTLVDTFEQRRR